MWGEIETEIHACAHCETNRHIQTCTAQHSSWVKELEGHHVLEKRNKSSWASTTVLWSDPYGPWPWPFTTCLKYSQHLTSQPATNWSQTHFTSGHIDGYWARVLFSSPEILNYTLAMGTPTQGQRPHQRYNFQACLNLALTHTLKHDTVLRTMWPDANFIEDEWRSHVNQKLKLEILKPIKEVGLKPCFAQVRLLLSLFGCYCEIKQTSIETGKHNWTHPLRYFVLWIG